MPKFKRDEKQPLHLTGPIDPILTAAGAALCLMGWALYWGGLNLAGAALGAGAALFAASLAIEYGNLGANEHLILAGAGGAGFLIGVFLIRKLHYGAIGLAGAAIGLVAGAHFAELAAAQSGADYRTLGPLVGSAVGGFLFIMLHKFVIVLVTAAAGALLLEMGLNPEPAFIVFGGAFLLSVVLQYTIARKFRLIKK